MNRLGLSLKLVWSSFVWAALGVTVLQVAAVAVLQPWHFVEKIELIHIQILYEYTLPFIASLIMCQLFVAELDKETSGWFMSLPFRSSLFFGTRWLLGTATIFILYLMGIAAIHLLVLPIPLRTFSYHVLPPALWLGHLALLGSLIGRTYIAGISVSLFYWVMESLTNGAITDRLYLFSGSLQEGAELVWNRNALLLGSLLAFILCIFVFGRRTFFVNR